METLASIKQLRIQAFERGERFFHTGRPCKEGHISKRYASNGCCVECLTPGASQRSLSRYQAAVVKRFSFWCLVPVATTESEMLEFKRYLASCALQWEKSKDIPVGMNNWPAKINGDMQW